MEEEAKVVNKKRLSPEATMLLTIGGFALAIVVYGIIHFILTSF